MDISVDRIDWDSQVLPGTVVRGSGCGFDVWVQGVFAQRPDKTVQVDVRATQTGLCEKAWAEPMWVLVPDVPADYRGGFLLGYTSS